VDLFDLAAIGKTDIVDAKVGSSIVVVRRDLAWARLVSNWADCYAMI